MLGGGLQEYNCKWPAKAITYDSVSLVGSKNMAEDTEDTKAEEERKLDRKFKAAAILRDKRTHASPLLRLVAANILRE